MTAARPGPSPSLSSAEPLLISGVSGQRQVLLGQPRAGSVHSSHTSARHTTSPAPCGPGKPLWPRSWPHPAAPPLPSLFPPPHPHFPRRGFCAWTSPGLRATPHSPRAAFADDHIPSTIGMCPEDSRPLCPAARLHTSCPPGPSLTSRSTETPVAHCPPPPSVATLPLLPHLAGEKGSPCVGVGVWLNSGGPSPQHLGSDLGSGKLWAPSK